MPKRLQKSFQDYLSKIRNHQLPTNYSFSSSKSWILSGCKHPKTLSFAIDDRTNDRRAAKYDYDNDNENDDAATLSDVDRFLMENFKSLYLRNDDEDNRSIRNDDDSPKFVDTPSRAGDCGPRRFFVGPSLSGSLMEEARVSLTATSDDVGSSSTSTTTANESSRNSHDHPIIIKDDEQGSHALPEDCIAVLTYSPSPHEEFRRSMQEVVGVRVRNHERVDWEFMEELLFCYLNLNDKKSYKFILSAFVDQCVVLRQKSTPEKVPEGRRSVRTALVDSRERERRKKVREVT